jgi:CO/xanthine dehydrogenase Mo-binding subunit
MRLPATKVLKSNVSLNRTEGKEASEGAIVSSPPSIISAIHHATGIWFKEQPVTPEMVVIALKQKNAKP